MGSYTSDAQRALANVKEKFEDGDFDREHEYRRAAKEVSEAVVNLQFVAGHHPNVKPEIDEAAKEMTEILSSVSTYEVLEDDETIPDDVKEELYEFTKRLLDLSMKFRDPGFDLESIRY